jgi:small subunit ribosomal protein S1
MTDPQNPPAVPAAPAQEPIARPSVPDRSQSRRESVKPRKPPELDRLEVTAEPPRLRDLDSQIEAELDAAMSGLSDKDLYGEPSEQQRPGRRAETPAVQNGKVMRVHQGDVFVEMPGGRSQGLLSVTQFPDGPPNIGDAVEFHIERYDPANGLFVLSRQGAATVADWSTVHIGQVVEARVTGTNKGGLSVEVNGIRGFLPISQIEMFRVENVEQYVNQRLVCMVAEVNPEERNLVVSRKALLERERQEKSEKLWAELREGQIHKGVVRSVKPFGAFVDLGGVDGLIPVGEMSWKRVSDPSEVVQPGQTVEVVVSRIDLEKRKVSLSLRQLVASPYEQMAVNYPPRTLVKGKVTRTAEFGAFVEIEPGIEGLIHVSELSPNRVFKVSNVVKPGDEVEVMVLGVDAEKKRISLSLRQAQQAKAAAAAPTPSHAEPEEEEAPAPAKPPRPRTTPLKGGIGSGAALFPDLPSHGQ